MDLPRFFASVRASVFGGRLSQSAVDGCEAILASCRRNGVTDPHHVANIMAQVHHETGGYMLPIKETVFASHEDKNPSDGTVIARLDRAFARGQLTWVKTPYWREGWFGRGQIQLSHETNYRKMGDRLGVDLVANPSLALDPAIGSDIAVVGMSEGMFTGKKLSDYDFPAALDASPSQNPRRIVNGQDGTDAKIAKVHRQFFTALSAAGFGEMATPAEPVIIVQPQEPAMPAPTPRPDLTPVEQSNKAVAAGTWAALASAVWTAIVAADVLPPQFATPEFQAAVGGIIAAVAAAIGAYKATDKRFQTTT